MYRKYFVYIDDGKDVYRVKVPAICEDAARAFCRGNGEIVAVKDVTDDVRISAEEVCNALLAGGVDDTKVHFIIRVLQEFEIVK